ncbi:type II toxin-antitoxin system VapC family toxin [Benzoatithermus flavus]|uniref:Type II toxin-antitoxin system VapC family toxin n=1 Tax=Benzoatithermus flavus TaxID=3108223 RepID=A0ABU8XLP5_9PROT
MRFVVDSSAVLAIRQAEPEREALHDLLLRGRPSMSLATRAELVLVWQGRFGASTLPDLDLPLLSKGEGFAQTDIRAVPWQSGRRAGRWRGRAVRWRCRNLLGAIRMRRVAQGPHPRA